MRWHRALSPTAWAGVFAISLALAALVVVLATSQVPADALRYRAMTKSLLDTGEFREDHMSLPWALPGEFENGYTHYFSPLWPIAMAPFYLLLGERGFEAATFVACGFGLAAAFLVSRRLYGDEVALVATSGSALFLLRVASHRGGEPLAFGFFVLMIGSIMASVRPGKEHWILLAGLMAGLAYLTRASVGWLFVLGGGLGALWRLRFQRRRAFNRHYLGAIGIFVALWGLWALRNLVRFWDGSVGDLAHALSADAVFEWKFQRALAQPLRFAYLIPLKLLLGIVFLLPFLALRRRTLLWQLRGLGDETRSGLVLTWLVPLATGSIMAAVFTIADANVASPLLNIDNLRYFVFALPGAVWGPWNVATQEPQLQAAALAAASE